MKKAEPSETTKSLSNADFIRMLEDALEGCRVADRQGDIDWEMGILQAELMKIPPILDENGGL